MPAPRRLLIAYDGSEGARSALEHLARHQAGLSEPVEALVLCLANVWTTAALPMLGPYGLGEVPITETRIQAIKSLERRAVKEARAAALTARSRLLAACPQWSIRAEASAAAPAWGIIHRAEEWPADLIVLNGTTNASSH